ncbi:unnamed protein product [Calicophoron daubneyi]|uniref:PDZ domain-containing protein n=1 Tax=Calicophoron daubneyi TaxID=300641 RepID=A0AAV2TNU5_CALDB
MALHYPLTRSSRGPLRALPIQDLVSAESCFPAKAQCTSNLPSNLSSATPVRKIGTATRGMKRQSLGPILPAPLRTSSCRSFNPSISSAEDIRRHFPIRTTNSRAKISTDFGDSLGDPAVISDVSPISLSPSHCPTSQKRPRIGDADESPRSRCKTRRSDCMPSVKSELRPAHITMGAGIKTHPSYCRRHSDTESGVYTDSTQNCHRRLSPICPVPMPCGFPAQFPLTYTSVSLPWDRVSMSAPRPLTSKSVETQTSPTSSGDGNDNRPSRSRRRSGSSHMLTTLRKTFGNIRRAISADRLQRASQSPHESFRLNSSLKNDSGPQTPSSKTKFGRLSSKRVGLSGHKRRRSSFTTPVTGVGQGQPAVPSSLAAPTSARSSDDARSSGLTCTITGKFPDGSLRIVLRRQSKNLQFGFFIARDSNGIYISRLGSVRCAAKLWDVFHVGDRILEVQGIPCSRMEVEDVQNLIRGCELADFRVRPARVNRMSR